MKLNCRPSANDVIYVINQNYKDLLFKTLKNDILMKFDQMIKLGTVTVSSRTVYEIVQEKPYTMQDYTVQGYTIRNLKNYTSSANLYLHTV